MAYGASARCPFCSEEAGVIFDTTDRNRKCKGRFIYRKCPACGLVFNSSPPANLADFYVGGYQRIPNTVDELRSIAKAERYRLEALLKFRKMGRLLEIGPWMGLFCILAKDAGFEVTALEMDKGCVRFLRETVGVRAVESTDPASTLCELRDVFDIIVMWHSIEHIPKPWEAIRCAAKSLSSGGLILIAAPNPDAGQLQCLGDRWYHLDAPRHQYLLPMSLLERIGSENRLKLVFATTSDELSTRIQKEAWDMIIHPYVPIPGIRRIAKISTRAIMNRLYRTGVEGRGAGYTMVFQAA
jgi:2-polyprenyl-3-methyl-5-hydroxy-6-metoxy-1,4-benzoquinol methylase